ncbi:MAG: aspartate:alanine exchanger family transporter [Verrucomicrobiota bacterium]
MNHPILHEILSHPLIALFLIIGLGLALGKISIQGMNLGSSGVLFLALIFGHLGYVIPAGVGTFGLVLFVYCVGIAAGGRFFAAIRREGSRLALLSVVIVGSGAALAVLAGHLLKLPGDLTAGIFAGALTSTPALAAASEALKTSEDSALVIGYGIAYPFGVIGVVLFVQALPRILKLDMSRGQEDEREREERVHTVLVEVTNPNLFGKKIDNSEVNHFNACQISRIVRSGNLTPLAYDDVFEAGQILMVVGRKRELEMAIELMGKQSDQRLLRDVENELKTLLVTDKRVSGLSLRELRPLKKHGVVITRIHRLGLEFVPNADSIVEMNDMLTVVGDPQRLAEFATLIGHRPNSIHETDLLSLSIGLAVGILLGIIPLTLPGGEPIMLGLAGGPLVAGLILGNFGRVGRLVGHIPRPTRILLQEFGLVLFLADAGVKGGEALVETLQAQGVGLFLAGIAVTIIPLALGYLAAVKLLKIEPVQALGGICGGMTSTPALGAITSKTDSQTPVVSYATAYPVALILLTVVAKMVVKLMG